jgi:hypothetical protein
MVDNFLEDEGCFLEAWWLFDGVLETVSRRVGVVLESWLDFGDLEAAFGCLDADCGSAEASFGGLDADSRGLETLFRCSESSKVGFLEACGLID